MSRKARGDPIPRESIRQTGRRVLRRIVAVLAGLCLLVFVALGAVSAAGPWLWPERDLSADLIVVLTGGAPEPPDLLKDGHDRVETGARLLARGVAPRLLVTGREARLPGLKRDVVPDLARSLGVPEGALLREPESRSTLQNALFSRRLLGDFPPHIVLVTDAYHLPRAWASFKWAGAQRISLVATRDFPERRRTYRTAQIAREVAAWGFNIARLASWTAADALGFAPSDALLR